MSTLLHPGSRSARRAADRGGDATGGEGAEADGYLGWVSMPRDKKQRECRRSLIPHHELAQVSQDRAFALAVARAARDRGKHPLREAAERQRLQPDPPRTGQRGVEQALAAEEGG